MGGFIRINDENDSDSTGKLKTFSVASSHATLLAPGDVVVITGDQNATTGLSEVDAAAAGAAFTGVIAAVQNDFEGDLTETGLPASTGGKVRCHVDQNLTYRVTVSGGPLTVADVGLNADIVATAASKSGGLTVSNMELDAGTAATTQTLQWRIVGIEEDANGTLGNVAIVRPNNTTANDGAAGVS